MKRAIGLTLIVAVSGLALIACTVEDDGAGSSQDYLGQVSPSLDRALDATDEWNLLQEELFQIDATRLSLSEVENLLEEQMAAARKAKTTFSDALTVMQSTTAPDECLEAHVAIIESLQLSERGFSDIVSALTLALRGGSGDDALESGNRLLAEADRVKARALPEIENCG